MGINLEGMVFNLKKDTAKEAAERIFRHHIELIESSDGGWMKPSSSSSDIFYLIDFGNVAVIILGGTESFMFDQYTGRIGDSQKLKRYLEFTEQSGTSFSVCDTSMSFYFRWYSGKKRTKLFSVKYSNKGPIIKGSDHFNFLENERDISMEILPELIMEYTSLSFEEVDSAPYKIYKIGKPWTVSHDTKTFDLLRKGAEFFIQNKLRGKEKCPPFIEYHSDYLEEIEQRDLSLSKLLDIDEIQSWNQEKMAEYVRQNLYIHNKKKGASNHVLNFYFVYYLFLFSFENPQKSNEFFNTFISNYKKQTLIKKNETIKKNNDITKLKKETKWGILFVIILIICMVIATQI